MAEAAIAAALKVLRNALAGELVRLAFSKYEIFANLKSSMNRITRELRVMKAYLEEMVIDAESINSEVVWVREVQNLANQIEDIVIEFAYLVGSNKFRGILFYGKTLLKKPKTIVTLQRIASELSDAEKSLKHLAEIKLQWVLPRNARISRNSGYSYSHKIAHDAHFIDENQIVGMEDDRARLTNWLNSDDPKLSVISIWGMGGVGKTTLVTNVFKREMINFDCHAWITISQIYTNENLLQYLISDICKRGNNNQIDTIDMDLRELKETLRNLLEGKKYCIVLDDMWDPKAYHELSNTLIDNQRGSRIVITSRESDVANLAPQSYRLKLKPLPERESWELFCKKAFPFEENHECPSRLEKWARGIVSKCDGLPLALVSLGSVSYLFENSESQWKLLHNQLRTELENNTTLGPLKSILNLSFKYLPRYLKNCFLYCSLFPEDFIIARKHLIKLWVAEGLIEKKGRSTLEEVAAGYLNELIHRNLLLVVETNTSGRVKRCRMHDMLRELAIALCRKENFGLVHEDNNPLNVDSSTRRLSIAKLSEEIGHDVFLPQLRTFMCFDHTVPLSLWLSSIFDKSRYLTVLDLGGLPMETLPNSIGDLFNLRYLGLRETNVKLLPKGIKKLQNLQVLDLSNSKLQNLPSAIANLKYLRHLYADIEVDPTHGTFQILRGIPLSRGISYLKDLQTMQTVESNTMVVRELGNLSQLRSLRIVNVKENHSADLCKSLSKMSFLSLLSMHASNENEILHLESLKLPQIQKLEIRGRLKEKMLESPLFQSSAYSVQMLMLGWSQLQNDPLSSLSKCKNLTFLYLQRAYTGRQLIYQAGWFPKLKNLVLRQMPNLVQVKMEEGTMMSLEKMYLWQLKNLVEIPKGMENLVALKEMTCMDMPTIFGGLAKGTHQLHHFNCRVF